MRDLKDYLKALVSDKETRTDFLIIWSFNSTVIVAFTFIILYITK